MTSETVRLTVSSADNGFVDYQPDDVEPCPICCALVMDLYEHIIWHGEDPVGSRFRKRFDQDLDAQRRVRANRTRRRGRPGRM